MLMGRLTDSRVLDDPEAVDFAARFVAEICSSSSEFHGLARTFGRCSGSDRLLRVLELNRVAESIRVVEQLKCAGSAMMAFL
jgi:hypothetical protein